jgi:hypothetical protein
MTIIVCEGIVGFVPTFVNVDVWFFYKDFGIFVYVLISGLWVWNLISQH